MSIDLIESTMTAQCCGGRESRLTVRSHEQHMVAVPVTPNNQANTDVVRL